MTEGQDIPEFNPNIKAEATLDIKRFQRFLFCDQLDPANVVCCIVNNEAFTFHVIIGDIYVTYYLPAIAPGV